MRQTRRPSVIACRPVQSVNWSNVGMGLFFGAIMLAAYAIKMS